MGVLKTLTDEYFGKIERKEDAIIGLKQHDFTDKNGVFHKDGYYIEDGDKKQLRRLIKKLMVERGRNCDLNDIDVSNVTDMSRLFGFVDREDISTDFCGDVSGWDVSSVTNMERMFTFCSKFNCDISNWDVSSVTNMSGMFTNCYDFNQDLNKWGDMVENVTDMAFMFSTCINFNKSIKWKTKNVTNFLAMFEKCEKLDEPLELDFTSASSITSILSGCKKFNQDLSGWNIENIIVMDYAFKDCESFDQDLSGWAINYNLYSHKDIFENCPIKEEHKPNFEK